MDKEFLQYIDDTGYIDLLNLDEKTIVKYKNTFHYQVWRLGKVIEEFKKAVVNCFRK